MSRGALALGLLRALVDLLLPRVCAVCGDDLPVVPPWGGVCRACLGGLPGPACPEPTPPEPLSAWATGASYEGGWVPFVQRFKYPRPGLTGLDPAADAVAEALARRAALRLPGRRPDLLVPIPMHPARLARRGFGPPLVLARAVGRSQGLAVAPRALLRVRDTPSQTGLGVAGRHRNVAGAFEAGQRLPPRVWLVDDVVTTGATLAEAARAAYGAGAKQVSALAAVRTPLRGGRIDDGYGVG